MKKIEIIILAIVALIIVGGVFTAANAQKSTISVSENNDTCIMLISYAPSQWSLDQEDVEFITEMLADFEVADFFSYADAANNLNGMSNEELADRRRGEIAAITNVYGQSAVAGFVSANMRFTQITFVRKSARVFEELNVQVPSLDTFQGSVMGPETIKEEVRPATQQEIDSLVRAAYLDEIMADEYMASIFSGSNAVDTIVITTNTNSTDSVYFCDCRNKSVKELYEYHREMLQLSRDKTQPLEIIEAAELCAKQTLRFANQEKNDKQQTTKTPTRKAKRVVVRGNGRAHMGFAKWFNMRTGLCMF